MAGGTFCDSFAPYGGDIGWLGQRWTQTNAVAGLGTAFGIAGRSGVNLGSNGSIRKTLTATATTTIGFRYRINLGSASYGGVIFEWAAVAVNRGLATLVQLQVFPDATLGVYAGSNIIINPTTFSFTSANWYYIELSLTLSGSGSSAVTVACDLHVNGVSIGTGSAASNVAANFLLAGVTGAAAKADFYTWSVGTTSGSNYLTDLYIRDDTTFDGDVAVGAIYARADGTVSGYAPSSGSDLFSRINEVPPDGDSSYIMSDVVGDIGECFFDTVASFSGQILGVQFSVLARKDDEGVRAFKYAVGPGAAYTNPNDVYIADSYRYYHVFFDSDPASGSGWSVADLNAQQFGMKTTV